MIAMNYLFLLFSIFLTTISWGNELKKIHIVSFNPDLAPREEVSRRLLKEGFELSFHHDLYKYVKSFRGDNQNLKKIIFFDYCEDLRTRNLPRSKMICFKWEAIKINPRFYNFYYRVYTFDDDLVDNIKFFKFYCPVLQPMLPTILSFEEKKLCTMVATNWIPERIAILDFFATKPEGSLDFYGWTIPPQYVHTKMNKGEISGSHSGQEKLNTLKNYKFCICFENNHTVPGYITEKIFNTFAAGSVPIYWGPENVEDYIPANCFIDYRKFKNNQEMYDFITSMTDVEYEQYINHIREFLQSEKARLFSLENFDEILYQAAID